MLKKIATTLFGLFILGSIIGYITGMIYFSKHLKDGCTKYDNCSYEPNMFGCAVSIPDTNIGCEWLGRPCETEIKSCYTYENGTCAGPYCINHKYLNVMIIFGILGFIGIFVNEDDERYMYQYQHDIKRFDSGLGNYAYCIHPGFRKTLGCT